MRSPWSAKNLCEKQASIIRELLLEPEAAGSGRPIPTQLQKLYVEGRNAAMAAPGRILLANADLSDPATTVMGQTFLLETRLEALAGGGRYPVLISIKVEGQVESDNTIAVELREEAGTSSKQLELDPDYKAGARSKLELYGGIRMRDLQPGCRKLFCRDSGRFL